MPRVPHALAARLALAAIAVSVAIPAIAPGLARAQTPAPTPAPTPVPPAFVATVTLGTTTVTGQARPSAELTLEVLAPGGSLKAGGSGNALPFIGFYSLGAANADGQAVPITSGDRVRLLEEGGRSIEGVVPVLTIAGDADTEAVSGMAPPGAVVTVTVSGAFGANAASVGATADAGGRYSASFAGTSDLQAGSNLRADHVAGAFTFRVERPLTEQVNIRLYSNAVTGLGPNGAPVRMELRRGGQVVAQGQGSGAFLGLFGVDLLNPAGNAVPVQPGDMLRAEVGGSPSLDYTVPDLALTVDVAADTIAGRAPAGAAVRVTAGGGPNPPAQTATAGADGRYTVSFAGTADLAPGSSGQITSTERRGGVDVSVARAWGVTRLAVRLGEPRVDGVASPGDPVRLTLRDSIGVPKAQALVEVAPGGVFGGGGTFAATLVDATDTPVDIVPTQTLLYRRTGESIDLDIPRLTAEVDATGDKVTGQAPPNGTLTVTAGPFFGQQARDVTADASGQYSADFTGVADITPGSPVTVRLTVAGGHWISLATAAASLRVWPEAGRVDGTVAGGASVQINVVSASGAARATASATANFLGQFNVALADTAGKPYYPLARDRVRVSFGDAMREVVVPPLGIEWDTAADRVFGETTPGGTVTVRAQPPASQGNGAVTRSMEVPGSGFYEAVFAPDMDLRAGSRLQITYAYPGGDRIRIDRVLPYLDIQVGGNAVAGFALPRVDVRSAVKAGGRTVAGGTARAGDDQSFALRVSDPVLNRPVAIAAGQTVEVEFDVRKLGVAVGPLAARFVPAGAGFALRGTGPISTVLTARFVGSNGTPRTVNIQTDATGAYSRTIPAGIDGLAGTEAEISHLNAEGHRFFALAVRPRLIAYIGSARADLAAMPLTGARLALAPAGSPPVAQANTATDTTGRAEATLAGAVPLIAAGQTLSAAVDPGGPNAETAEMTVADVALRLDTAANTVAGRVPPGQGFFGRFATVRAFIRGEAAPRAITVLTDAEGAFSLDTTNPGGFAQGFPLSAAERIEVVHTAPSGHQTVAVAIPAITIYLPRAVNR